MEENALLKTDTSDSTVNYTPTVNQTEVSVAANKNRNSVVAWREVDGNSITIKVSAYAWNNSAIFNSVQVSDLATGNRKNIEVVMSDSDLIWVVWQEDSDDNGTFDIAAKALDFTGAVVVPAFTVNTGSTGNHVNPSITIVDSVQLFVAWQDDSDADGFNHIHLRGFSFQGVEIYAEQRLNTGNGGQHRQPDIATLSETKIVFAFEDDSDNNGLYQIHGSVLDLATNSLTPEFPVNSVATGQQFHPSVTVDGSGNFYVLFEDVPTNSLLVRGFNSDVSQRFPDSTVYLLSPGQYKNGGLVGLEEGFIAAWEETITRNSVSRTSIATRIFNSSGIALNDDFFWPFFMAESQRNGRLAVISKNEIIGVWTSDTDVNGNAEVFYSTRIFETDSDGDGSPDTEDDFSTDPYEWTDTDSDGIGNNADYDDDNDSLPDAWELARGLNPLVSNFNVDSDGDGTTDFQEYQDSTDPLDYESCSNPSCLVFLEATTTYTYHTNGQIETIDGPRTDVNDVTTYTYDTNSNVASVTNALSQSVQYTSYNARGNVLSMTDTNEVVTDFTYHPRGWMTQSIVRAPSGSGGVDQTTSYSYDNVGQLISITFPSGNTITYEYDGARRLTAIEDAVGNRQEYTLDAAGNRTAEAIKDSSGIIVKTMTQNFDELSRLREVIGAAGQTTALDYDVNDNNTADTNPRTFITNKEYDALNRLIKSIDPLAGETELAYDSQDNLTAVTDATGLSTTYTYDAFNNLIQLVSPDTGTTDYTYDSANNRTAMIDERGIIAQYSYDALNRLTSVAYPNNPSENITYGYDDNSAGNYGIGRLTQITDASGQMNYRYDFLGNLITKTYTINNQAFSLHYAYDSASRLTQITYPSGRLVNYSYNSLNQIIQVTTQADSNAPAQTVADNINYLPFGPNVGWAYGNGLTQIHNYDQDYRLTRQQLLDQTAVLDQSYDFDPNSNITAITNLLNVSDSKDFDYDALDRLNAAQHADTDIDFSYDAIGNRLTRTITDNSNTITETYTYDTDSHQLTQVAKNTNGNVTTRQFGYDPNGNLTTDSDNSTTTTHTYGDTNRPTQTQTTTEQLTYLHNSLGQRTQKTNTTSNQTERYHYNEAGQLIAVSDNTNAYTQEWIYLGNQVIAVLLETETTL
jgi:YD repeat-containing protein